MGRIFGNSTSSGSRYAATPIVISFCGTFSRSVPCSRSQMAKPLDQFEFVSSRTIALEAQAKQTPNNRRTAYVPTPVNASRARGFNRHIGSRKLPGNKSDTAATKLIVAPAKKKILRAVTPRGRAFEAVIIFNQQQLLPGSQHSFPDKSVTS